MNNILSLLAIFFATSFSFAQIPWEMWGNVGLSNTNGPIGNIFHLDANGTDFTADHAFRRYAERNPMYGAVVEASPGTYFGLTASGGLHGNGVLFRYEPSTGAFFTQIDFDSTALGKTPCGSVVKAGNGKLYGMAARGGTGNSGTIFRFDMNSGTAVKIHDFDSLTTGCSPYGSLIQAGNTKLYGMTSSGGLNNKGTLFELDIATGVVTTLVHFDGLNSGANPNGDLFEAANGKLYGLTRNGGMNGFGILFELDPATNTFVKKLDLAGVNRYPMASLKAASNGLLYATSSGDAANGSFGSVFHYNTGTNAITTIYTLTGSNGFEPTGNITETTTATLLFTASKGGTLSGGTLLELNLTGGGLQVRQSFGFANTYADTPKGSLLRGSDGIYYGMCKENGLGGYGTLFRYSGTTLSTCVDFNSYSPCSFTTSTYAYVNENEFYGLGNGGKYGQGIVYRLHQDTKEFETMVNVHSASGLVHDFGYSSFTQHANGKFYASVGESQFGPVGEIERGYIIEYVPGDTAFTIVHEMIALSDGYDPVGQLYAHTDGKLYGLNNAGGTAFHLGTLYSFDPATGVYTTLYYFNQEHGVHPRSSLKMASDGKLYGTTSDADGDPYGTFFSYDIATATFTDLHHFSGFDGQMASSAFTEGLDGKLYTVNQYGGAAGTGVLISYDIAADTVEVIHQFVSAGGGTNPTRELLLAQNGKLYGMTYGQTSIFEYDPATGVFTTTYTMDPLTEGSNSGYGGSLIEVCQAIIPESLPADTALCLHQPFVLTVPVEGSNLSYQWYRDGAILPGATTASLSIADPQLTDNHSFYMEIANGCRTVHSDTMNITVEPLPQVNAGADVYICNDSSVVLTATGTALTYTWNQGVINNTAFFPQTSAAYIVTGISAGGCVMTDTVSVFLMPEINPGGTTTACAESFVTLTATGSPAIYTWNNGITDGQPFEALISDTFIVEAIDVNGCVNRDTTYLTVYALPIVTAGADLHTCALTAVILQGSGAMTYAWNNGIINGVSYIPQLATTACVVTGVDMHGCMDIDSLDIFLDSCSHVWPGDTDNDGEVTTSDFFNLGLNQGAAGIARASISNLWESYETDWWADTIALGTGIGKNMNFTDCNGDGSVTMDDTLAIQQNYGLTHTFGRVENPYVKSGGDIYFTSSATTYEPNQLVTIAIHAGSETNPINGLYGLGFELSLNSPAIQPGSLTVQLFNETWIGTTGSDAIRLNVADGNTSHLALSRTDLQNISGYGIIGSISFLSASSGGVVDIGVSQPVAIDNSGQTDSLSVENFSVEVVGFASLNEASTRQLSLYPNPSAGKFTVNGLNPSVVYTIIIRDVIGNACFTQGQYTGTAFGCAEDFVPGTYFIEITGGSEHYRMPLIVSE